MLIIISFLIKIIYFPSTKKPTYLTAKVTRGNIQTSVLTTGAIYPIQFVHVGAQVSGQVKSLKVKLNETVKAGDIIAEIDNRTQLNELRLTEANRTIMYADRRAKLAELQQQEQVFKRQKTLFAAGASAKEEFELAQAKFEIKKEEIKHLDAEIIKAQIDVDKAKVNLGYTRIVSPIDGKVVAIITKEGQTVNASQISPTIVTIARTNKVTVRTQISEVDLPHVRVGQPVIIKILGLPERTYQSTLQAIEPLPQAVAIDDVGKQAIYYNGLFDLDNSDQQLQLAMTAQVEIILGKASQVLIIPAAALNQPQNNGNATVKVITKKGKPIERHVKVGLNNKVNTEILSGLQIGEEIVIGEVSAEKDKLKKDS